MEWWHPGSDVLAEDLPCRHCTRVDRDDSLHVVADGCVARLGNLRKSFGRVKALDDVTLEVRHGEIVGILGRSGAGKSTLIRCMNGLETPDRGRVEIFGHDVAAMPLRWLQHLRGRIGMIFQQGNLLRAKTVAENVALPLKILGVPPAERAARVRQLLALVGLSGQDAVYPAKLSAGHRQLVGIARALAGSPALLLCDEPTAALDRETTVLVLDLLRDVNRRLGVTVVLATRETNLVRPIADRLIVLDAGGVVEEGEAWRVITAPQTAIAQRLVDTETSELPCLLRNGLSDAWSRGAHLVLRIQLSGDAAHRPVLAQMTSDLGVLPVVLHASVQSVQDHALASFIIAFNDQSEPLARRVGEYLAARVSRLEVLGYVHQLV
jgi:D-methionine transport system ATP-binding protein